MLYACIRYRDEPALKATFTLTLVVDQHLTALSNMPEGKCIQRSVLNIYMLYNVCYVYCAVTYTLLIFLYIHIQTIAIYYHFSKLNYSYTYIIHYDSPLHSPRRGQEEGGVRGHSLDEYVLAGVGYRRVRLRAGMRVLFFVV